MTKASVATIVQALNDAGVNYLVVGGVAVNAHGYVRLTVDVDLILNFDPANLDAAIKAFQQLGYRPKVPVSLEDFKDAGKRLQWFTQKNAQVLSLQSDQHRETDIDLFITDPLGFSEAYARAQPFEVVSGVKTTVCSYPDLVKLKLAAGRPKDLIDLEQLSKARGES